MKTSLWQHRDFLRFWAGETISLFGTQITAFAVPVMAALILKATPEQMGLLKAAEFAPFILFTLWAGVWVDRHYHRPIMILASLGRGLLLMLIPLAALLGWLRMELLISIAFLVGSLQVFFDLAYQTYVPILVSSDHLIEANSKLQIGASVAQSGGPGVAGLLVALITAPYAIVLDGLSYLASAVGIALIHKPETQVARPIREHSMLHDIRDGLRIVFRNQIVFALLMEAVIANFFGAFIDASLILFATRELGIQPALLGGILTLGSLGSVLGAIGVQRFTTRWGLGRTLLVAYSLATLPNLLLPLASGSVIFSAGLLITAFFLIGLGVVVSNILVISIRQACVSQQDLGRMNAAYRFLVTGVYPLGALVGGALGGILGLRPTLVIAAGGLILSVVTALFSPLPRLRTLTDPSFVT